MITARRGVIAALIVGSIVGGTASATIITASHSGAHERMEAAQHLVHASLSPT
jgi:hypothetical protein